MRIAFPITRMDSIGGAQIHACDISLWPVLRIAMGEGARARYEGNFTTEHMLRPTLGIYRAVLRVRRELALAPAITPSPGHRRMAELPALLASRAGSDVASLR